jgi:hypothetical protein
MFQYELLPADTCSFLPSTLLLVLLSLVLLAAFFLTLQTRYRRGEGKGVLFIPLSNSVTIEKTAMLITQKEMKNSLRKKQIKQKNFQIQAYCIKGKWMGSVLVFHFRSLPTKKTHPSNLPQMTGSA